MSKVKYPKSVALKVQYECAPRRPRYSYALPGVLVASHLFLTNLCFVVVFYIVC